MDPSELARVRRLVGEVSGVSLDDISPQEMQRVLRDAGLPVDDPAQVVELLQRWDALQPAMLAAAVDPETDAFLVVDPTFQAAMDRLGPRATDADALAGELPWIRAIVATRLVDGLVANGGWTAVFTEGLTRILPVAIDGYGLLGLDEHASLAARALEHGFTPPGLDAHHTDDPAEDAFWENLDGSWFELPSAEVERAAYIRANPDVREASRLRARPPLPVIE